MTSRVRRAALLSAVLVAGSCRQNAGSRANAAPGTPVPAADGSGRKVLYWYDPMAPGSKFDKPGQSPFMDMPLVPKYADELGGPGASSSAAVVLSPDDIQATGVATVRAERAALARTIRAVGTVETDETRQVRVAARVAGRVEKVYASFMGQAVRAGSPLFALYSPELVATEREYLLALENRQRLAGATTEAVRSAEDLVQASRQRLRLWGLGPVDIEELERQREPALTVTFRSPITGTVMQKTVLEGQYVTEGTELYLLADLSTVWLMAQVYEYELGRLRVGQEAAASVSALPGQTFRGRIAFIDPALDRETRSARVRIALSNPRGELKPGMFADARLEIPAAAALVIPKSAVIDTGARRVVYVETSPNTFRAREVRTGDSGDDRIAILEGLAEGDRVVAAANFFVDSQAQLSRGAAIQYSGALDVKERPEEPKP